MLNRKRKKQKNRRKSSCPCPKKPPIPKVAPPAFRPWSIPDYTHIRRQYLPKELRKLGSESLLDFYFGRPCTDVTEGQRELVPLHALHPNLVNAPMADNNRKVTSVTEYISHCGKPRTGPVITTPGMPWRGNRGTSITAQLRHVPPAHPMAKGAHERADPYYGIQATDITSGNERALPTIISSMFSTRPKHTVPSVVFPQHVNPALLVNAITEKRRMYQECSKPPNSARAPRSEAAQSDARTCHSARSEPASFRPNTISQSAPNTAPSTTGSKTTGNGVEDNAKPVNNATSAATSGVSLSTCSVRAGPPSSAVSSVSTPRPNKTGSESASEAVQAPRQAMSRVTASEVATPRSNPGPATTSEAAARPATSRITTPRPPATNRSIGPARPTPRPGGTPREGAAGTPSNGAATAAAVGGSTPRSLSGGGGAASSLRGRSMSARSERSHRSSQDTPASVSTTPQSSRGHHNTQELLNKATQRLGPEKFQRICNWSGVYEDIKPRTAWR